MQDHIPVTEQAEAVGHAVRATYMYAGMADVAALTGNADYIQAIDRLWENVVSKKLYLTGGVGARHTSEAFGDNYELPNSSAYTETCAAIGNAFWNHRMFLLHGEAKYIDVMERVLYNGLVSGVSLNGDCFFYQNPLESSDRRERSPWFEVACCPGNIVRFIPSFPGYIYAKKNENLYVNLYVQGEANIELKNQMVRISQETRYPWEGNIQMTVHPEKEGEFALFLRIPGWTQGHPIPSDLYRFLGEDPAHVDIRINGTPYPFEMEKGFAKLNRKWKPGDRIELSLPMPVRRVQSHENLQDNQGKIALQRGPIVYCFEEADNAGQVIGLTLPDDSRLETQFLPDLLGGLVVINSTAADKSPLTAIPYYAWAHRGAGEMAVWIHRK
jgi:DUF1680 family protein